MRESFFSKKEMWYHLWDKLKMKVGHLLWDGGSTSVPLDFKNSNSSHFSPFLKSRNFETFYFRKSLNPYTSIYLPLVPLQWSRPHNPLTLISLLFLFISLILSIFLFLSLLYHFSLLSLLLYQLCNKTCVVSKVSIFKIWRCQYTSATTKIPQTKKTLRMFELET